MNLQSYFSDVVAAGWAPRHPCTDPTELATLETSLTRGDCIAPLVQEGDVVFIDRTMKPQSGDVVSFALSQRGADVQNTPPMPPGQIAGQWNKGDRWCKLYGRIDSFDDAGARSFDMLFDRHGGSATATLLSCEDPDDAPVLCPVRQIRRGGRLLFTPDTQAAQVNVNAVSVIGSTLSAAASTLVATMPANSGVTLTQTQNSIAVTTSGFPIAVDAAANAFYSLASGVTLTLLNLQVLRDGSAVAGGEWDFTAGSTFTITGGGNSSAQQVTISCVDSPAAGSHTYSLLLTLRATGSAGGASATTSQNFLKVREIKR